MVFAWARLDSIVTPLLSCVFLAVFFVSKHQVVFHWPLVATPQDLKFNHFFLSDTSWNPMILRPFRPGFSYPISQQRQAQASLGAILLMQDLSCFEGKMGFRGNTWIFQCLEAKTAGWGYHLYLWDRKRELIIRLYIHKYLFLQNTTRPFEKTFAGILVFSNKRQKLRNRVVSEGIQGINYKKMPTVTTPSFHQICS